MVSQTSTKNEKNKRTTILVTKILLALIIIIITYLSVIENRKVECCESQRYYNYSEYPCNDKFLYGKEEIKQTINTDKEEYTQTIACKKIINERIIKEKQK